MACNYFQGLPWSGPYRRTNSMVLGLYLWGRNHQLGVEEPGLQFRKYSILLSLTKRQGSKTIPSHFQGLHRVILFISRSIQQNRCGMETLSLFQDTLVLPRWCIVFIRIEWSQDRCIKILSWQFPRIFPLKSLRTTGRLVDHFRKKDDLKPSDLV